MTTIKMALREEQGIRQSHFPEDRIAFHQSLGAANNDVLVFKKYFHGDISFDALRKAVAKNNYLELYFPDGMIPEDMMRNELKLLGYERLEENHGVDN